MKEKVIVLLGATATGKSALGLALAQKLDTEIISGDSMLVYKGFDIGTAKPKLDELKLVRHHLVDVISPEVSYSAAMFQAQAGAAIADINGRNKIPLMVGGTGLYLKALLEGYEFAKTRERPELRVELELMAEQNGSRYLFDKLSELAPQTAAQIHPHNKKRLLRALEVALSGDNISTEKSNGLVYDALVIGLEMDREQLYERINQRVEDMFAAGLTAEVRRLLLSGVPKNAPALQGIGYKEVALYLDGEISLEECKRLVCLHTRHFAKRQMTWYKKMPYINWVAAGDKDLLNNIYSSLVEWLKVG